METTLKVENIGISFGTIKALKGVSLAIHPGEVVALVGDNGAGKSTLIKIMSGALKPDYGDIYLGNEKIKFKGPAQARNEGIQTVYQDLAVAPDLDITDNLFLGKEKLKDGILGKLGFLDKKQMNEDSFQTLKKLNVPVNEVTQEVETLSGGQRQSVAVCRAVAWAKRLVIMDEPTAALGVEETENVLKLIKEVQSTGTPVLLVSHSMPEVFEVADKIVVLRLGNKVGELKKEETNMDEVVSLITGSKIQEQYIKGDQNE